MSQRSNNTQSCCKIVCSMCPYSDMGAMEPSSKRDRYLELQPASLDAVELSFAQIALERWVAAVGEIVDARHDEDSLETIADRRILGEVPARSLRILHIEISRSDVVAGHRGSQAHRRCI